MERIDDLQRGGLRLIQDTELFCFGTDSVLLADFVNVTAGDRVADIGCASGILLFLMYGRQPDAKYFGVELQKKLFDLCVKNIGLNGLNGSISAVCGNILDITAGSLQDFDVVVSNPPYEKMGCGAVPANESHMRARFEIDITFNALCSAAFKMLRSKGRFCFIHRAPRLPELFGAAKANRLEPKRLRFVHKNANTCAEYVLIECVKDGGAFLKTEPPLIMHGKEGGYTQELLNIYDNAH